VVPATIVNLFSGTHIVFPGTRYLLVYKDDRVAHVQVPNTDWLAQHLINKQGIRVREITVESESLRAGEACHLAVCSLCTSARSQ